MENEVDIVEFEAHLSKYVRAASEGEEIVIKDRDTPIAKLTPMPKAKWPPYVIPAKKPMHSTSEMKGVDTGLTPEEFDKLWEETRRDRLFEWATSKTST